MPSDWHLDFTAPEIYDGRNFNFHGRELSLSGDLTIFGNDMPEFRAWACNNGLRSARCIASAAEFSSRDHGSVAHDFGERISLGRMPEIVSRIRFLMHRSPRLVLFLDIAERCTLEDVRRHLRSHMPDLTFRIVYPRGLYKANGLHVILAERRRKRIFLFMSPHVMAGKTESALSIAGAGIAVVHGDERFFGIDLGEIAAPDELRRLADELSRGPPLNCALFAKFVDLMPEFSADTDVAFDRGLPLELHPEIMSFFEDRGYFPIMCLTSEDRRQIEQQLREAEAQVREAQAQARKAEARTSQAEAQRHQNRERFLNSTSWRLTAPVRWVGRTGRALIRRLRAPTTTRR